MRTAEQAANPGEAFALEPFGPAHLEEAVRLSREAGWPHRLDDWRFALELSRGVVAARDGRVLGTILTTPYGEDAATINMVIVDAAERGRGLGRRLMDAAFELAGRRPLRLVATQDGLALYEKLGFVRTGAILQHQGTLPPGVQRPGAADSAEAPSGEVVPAGPGDLPAIAALDRAAFGADRADLIRALARTGRFALLRRGAEVSGFAGLRAFGRGEVVGPVVAARAGDARTLIAHLLAERSGAFLRLDVPEESGLGPWLSAQGLAHVGGGIAMRRPAAPPQPPSAATTYALASQALG